MYNNERKTNNKYEKSNLYSNKLIHNNKLIHIIHNAHSAIHELICICCIRTWIVSITGPHDKKYSTSLQVRAHHINVSNARINIQRIRLSPRPPFSTTSLRACKKS